MIFRTEVDAAWGLIRPHVRRTPVIELNAGSLGVTAPLAVKLESLQVSGRMVGIITHVRELTDRMPACIVIDKRPDGSRWDVRR